VALIRQGGAKHKVAILLLAPGLAANGSILLARPCLPNPIDVEMEKVAICLGDGD
jgi:hypothetical protein